MGIIKESMTFPMDLTTIANGETLEYHHDISNQQLDKALLVEFVDNLGNISDPDSDYYGYGFRVLDTSDSEIFSCVVPPEETVGVDFEHTLNELFLQPVDNLLPFDLDIDFEWMDCFSCGGLYYYNPDTIVCDAWNGIDSSTGSLFRVTSYDGSEIIYDLQYPSDATEWQTITDTSVSVDFNDVDGTKVTLDPEDVYHVILKDGMYWDNYRVYSHNIFNTRDSDLGIIVYSSLDGTDYLNVHIDKHASPPSLFVDEVEDGVTTTLYSESTSIGANEPFAVRCDVDVDSRSIDVYMDGTLGEATTLITTETFTI
jgi:hypothetical protein